LNRLGRELSAKQFEKQILLLKSKFPGTKLSFDDGYKSVYDTVFPIIEKYEIPIKIYLNLNSIEKGFSWLNKLSYLFNALTIGECEELARSCLDLPVDIERVRLSDFWKYFDYEKTLSAIDTCFNKKKSGPVPRFFMDETQIRELVDHPLVEIGSHSRSHYPLHRLPTKILQDEIVTHHSELKEKFGKSVYGFAIPFGWREHITEEIETYIKQIDDFIVTSFGGNKLINRKLTLPEIRRVSWEEITFLR
jgi:hypothetical protein